MKIKTASSASLRGIPLRSYSSMDPLKACTPPTRACGSQSAEAPGNTSSSSIGSKKSPSFKISAKDFVKHKVGQDLLDDYIVNDTIGEGAFGVVSSCTHRASGSERAVKVIQKSRSQPEKVTNEFSIVRNLDHPNILKQYDMYESKDSFHLVTDIYRGGEMFDYLQQHHFLEENDAASLMNSLLLCVAYCHQNGVAHRDLKPENILLSDNRQWEDLKVIDFGLARLNGPNDGPMTDIYGTPYYVSPQVLDGEYTNKCDIWSCGTIAYLALAGFVPFGGNDPDGETMEDICEAVYSGEFDFDDQVWDDVSDVAKDFIRSLLTYEEDERPTALEALQHPWLVEERRASKNAVYSDSRLGNSMTMALQGMQDFEAQSKLKQATYALLSSQLLPREEREEIDHCWRILDADCTGRLTKYEVQKGFADFWNRQLTDEEVDDLFDKVAGNGEVIEYSEFVACLVQTEVLDETRLRAAFAMFDIDGSGSISADELRQVFSGCSCCNGDIMKDEEMIDAIMQILEQVDANSDGEIDFEEFQTMMAITASQPRMDAVKAWNVATERDITVGTEDESAVTDRDESLWLSFSSSEE